MEQQLIDLISALGSAGEVTEIVTRAFYVYLAVHYGTTLIFFGVSAMGIYHLIRYMIKNG